MTADGVRTVFRGRLGPLVAYPLAVAIVVLLVVVAVNLPGGEHGYGPVDRGGVIVIGLAVGWFLHRLASVRAVADERGLAVHNVLRTRRLEWAEVVAVRLGPDDPWLYVDLSDGTHLPVMGIQSADGDRARAAAAELAEMVARRSSAGTDA